MNQIATVADVKRLGTILCVWAHPDDETFSCAGIMAAALENGQKVACLTATKGEAGVQDPHKWPADKLGEIRAREMQNALDCIGCKNHSWLGYQDGHCAEANDAEAIAHVRKYIDLYQPDTILTFGPDGLTGHPDHQAVSKWATMAAGTSSQVYYVVEEKNIYENHLKEADKKFNIFFNIDKPPVWRSGDCDIAFELPPKLCAVKEKALRSMPSQYDFFFAHASDDMVQALICAEYFVKA